MGQETTVEKKNEYESETFNICNGGDRFINNRREIEKMMKP